MSLPRTSPTPPFGHRRRLTTRLRGRPSGRRFSSISPILMIVTFLLLSGCGPKSADPENRSPAEASSAVLYEPAYPEDVSVEELSKQDIDQQRDGAHSHDESTHQHDPDEEEHEHDSPPPESR